MRILTLEGALLFGWRSPRRTARPFGFKPLSLEALPYYQRAFKINSTDKFWDQPARLTPPRWSTMIEEPSGKSGVLS